MSKPWDDPEEKFEKKIRKIGRTGAYAIGGSIGLWIILAIFPKEEGHEKITGVIDNVVFMLFVYGCILFGAIIFKRQKSGVGLRIPRTSKGGEKCFRHMPTCYCCWF